ncbi:hypothetical protein Ppha_2588 [Pelodictyon phaeoclathratiforme BU-1]|uniref:Uncharacterized protein n=1 Tax=Pelodictyon phaeoclathratiforme (strain DSM 5477 / BU-1) TaxID=324925 RepID=B4SFH1_PELPB|nr:hypothetical protein Ppha_2588 [Pelodictyon phaeoclathratiforme BU-1]
MHHPRSAVLRTDEEATIPGAQLFAVFGGKMSILCTIYGNEMQERES